MTVSGRRIGLALASLACLALTGCPSESAAPQQDAAAVQEDASTPDPGLNRRPRPNQNTGGDPLPDCQRFDPTECGAGQKCQVVIRRAPGEEQFVIYPGCVERGKERSLGAPCVPWDVAFDAPGLEDEVYVDPCAEGLICADDPVVRNHMSCQPACESGSTGRVPYSCSSAGAFCNVGPGPLQEVCVETEGCDPRDPNACGPGRGCYLIPDDGVTGVLGLCAQVIEEPVEVGGACQSFTSQCVPGSSCWGPARVPPTRWVEEDLRCRRACSIDVEDFDAGADDEDGGPSGGLRAPECGQDEVCVPFEESGLDVSNIEAQFGQCES